MNPRIFFFLIFILAYNLNSNAQASKIVLLEEATGTWCSWCPEGKVLGESLLEKYDGQLIFLEVHRTDEMELGEYADSCSFYVFPSAHLDRKEKHVWTEEWEINLVNQLSETPPANVRVETDFNQENRILDVHIYADVFEDLEGDYRLAAIVAEDAITGDNETYSQDNIFADREHGIMGGFESLPDPVPYQFMVYDHVGRHLLGGYNGDVGSLPTELMSNSTYSYNYEWELPEEFNEDYIWITALLINAENGHILNAGKSKYLNGTKNARPKFVTEPIKEALQSKDYVYDIRYHDPNLDLCNIEIIEPLPSWLSFKKSRFGFASLEGIPTAVGNYEIGLRLTDDEYSIDQVFTIQVDEYNPPELSTLVDDFIIVPNPNDGMFKIEYTLGSQYEIYNSTGQLLDLGVLVRNINEPKYSLPINLNELQSGWYYMKITDNAEFTKVKKFFIAAKN